MNLINEINNAKPEDMNDILLTVRRRYLELFPGWDLMLISLEKNADKNAQLDQIIKLLQQMKEPQKLLLNLQMLKNV